MARMLFETRTARYNEDVTLQRPVLSTAEDLHPTFVDHLLASVNPNTQLLELCLASICERVRIYGDGLE